MAEPTLDDAFDRLLSFDVEESGDVVIGVLSAGPVEAGAQLTNQVAISLLTPGAGFRFNGRSTTLLTTTGVRLYQNTTGRDVKIRVRTLRAGLNEADVTNGPATTADGVLSFRIDLSVQGSLSDEYLIEPAGELWCIPTGTPDSAIVVVEFSGN